MPSRVGRATLAVVMMISPLAASSAHLWASNEWSWPGYVNTLAVLVALMIGITGLWLLPVPQWIRAAASPFYLVGMLALLLVWWFVFPCTVLARCF